MPNRIRVRLFAIQRELAGAREIALDLPPGATVEAAWTALVERHPVLAPGRPAVRFARNGEYTDPETALDDGDELAILRHLDVPTEIPAPRHARAPPRVGVREADAWDDDPSVFNPGS